jgi:hypothetical protein
VAHLHSVGSAHVHSARGPRLAGPASACAARDCAALHVSAHRSDHCSPGVCRGAAGGGATMAEVEQGKALEHPRRRGHPPGMWVEAVAHRSFLPTGRGENQIGSGVLGRGVGSGGRQRSCVRVEGERKLGSTIPREKAARGGGARAPLTVEGFATVEVAEQRRWRAQAGARRSDGDVVGFGHGRWRGRNGAREKRRGEAASAAWQRFWTQPVRNGRSGRLLTHPVHSDIAAHGSQSGCGARRHCN